jgi:hypothetical protein
MEEFRQLEEDVQKIRDELQASVCACVCVWCVVCVQCVCVCVYVCAWLVETA